MVQTVARVPPFVMRMMLGLYCCQKGYVPMGHPVYISVLHGDDVCKLLYTRKNLNLRAGERT